MYKGSFTNDVASIRIFAEESMWRFACRTNPCAEHPDLVLGVDGGGVAAQDPIALDHREEL